MWKLKLYEKYWSARETIENSMTLSEGIQSSKKFEEMPHRWFSHETQEHSRHLGISALVTEH